MSKNNINLSNLPPAWVVEVSTEGMPDNFNGVIIVEAQHLELTTTSQPAEESKDAQAQS